MSDTINVQLNSHIHEQGDKLHELMEGSGATDFLLIFNKASGAYMGRAVGNVGSTAHDSTHYKFKRLKFDPTIHEWRGDFDNGALVEVINAPVRISEEEIDTQTGYSIRDVHDWHNQVNVLFDVVEKLIEKNNLSGEEVDDFKSILDYVKGRRGSGENFKEAYKDNPSFEYESKEEMVARLGRELDGGLHEELGPKSQQMPHHDIAEAPDVSTSNVWLVNKGLGGPNKGNTQ